MVSTTCLQESLRGGGSSNLHCPAVAQFEMIEEMDVVRAFLLNRVIWVLGLLALPLAAQEASDDDCAAVDPVYATLVQKSCGELPQSCDDIKSFDRCVEKIFMSSLSELSISTKAILQAGRDASG